MEAIEGWDLLNRKNPEVLLVINGMDHVDTETNGMFCRVAPTYGCGECAVQWNLY